MNGIVLMTFTGIFGPALAAFFILYAAFILAFTWRLFFPGKRDDRPAPENPDTAPCLPAVSVIIPVRNEAGHMTRILEEMRGQDYPRDLLEVIVADDQSDDLTMELARSFSGRYPQLSVVSALSDGTTDPAGGKKRAIQRAIRLAKGEIILCTDADTTHGPRWISSMAGCFTGSRVRMVLGPVVFDPAGNLLQKMQALEFMGIMGTTAGSAGLGRPVMCNGANLAYRRSAFLDTGGFEKNLRYHSGDDQFLMNSVRSRYGKKAIVFNRDREAIVATEPEACLSGFIHQRIRWVSKSRGYRDPLVIAVGLVTWLVHLLLFAGLITGIFRPAVLCIVLAAWSGKILLEYPLVRFMSRFFRKMGLLVYYPVAQVFQLVYVPLTGLLGLFLPYRWKGRKIRR